MKVNLNKILACPKCKVKLTVDFNSANCSQCRKKYPKKSGIWHLLTDLTTDTLQAQLGYNDLFKQEFGAPQDGSYEILASFARGNRTLDIACGIALIESLAADTISLDFSIQALKQAQKRGAKNLILADAHNLPFTDDSFDLAISAGNLEHFSNPQQAVSEMARVAKIHISIVHKALPIPFAKQVTSVINKLLAVKHQPIEKPLTKKELFKLFSLPNLNIVYYGVWNFPVNYQRVIKLLPELTTIPSAWLVISHKNSSL